MAIPALTAGVDNGAAFTGTAQVMHFIAHHALFGTGIGNIDAHLLAAVRLSPGALLWTRDRRSLAASNRLGLSANLTH